MRDIDVRRALHATELTAHQGEPDTLVIDELGLAHGRAIIDVAVVNGRLHGYEIKSARDNLERLPSQVPIYSAALDQVTLVVAECHRSAATKIIPTWWAVLIASLPRGGELTLNPERLGKPNPEIDPVAVASLLWRDEALGILEEIGAAKGMRSKPRRALYQRLSEVLDLATIRERVRLALKRRQRDGWRPDALRTSDGG